MTSIRQSKASGIASAPETGRGMRRIRAIAAGIRAAGAIPPALAGTFPALVALLALLLLLPGAAPAQTEDLDPLTRLERDLAGLDEEGVYRKAEALNLGGGSYDLTRRAYQEILNRFSTGSHAPKAAFQLAMVGLRDVSNWDRSVERLAEASNTYSDSSLGKLAAEYHEALTAPKNARHIELLADLFHRGHLVARGPGMSSQVSVDFLVMLMSRTFKEKPVLDWLVADRSLTEYDKCLLAFDVANMLYRAAQREMCKTVCEWIVKEYPDEPEGQGRALVLLGDMRWMYAQDRDGAERYYRQAAAETSGTLEIVPEAFWYLAENHLGPGGDRAKAKALLEEIRTKWPKSEWSLKAREMLCRDELASFFGIPAPMTADEQNWQALRKWESDSSAALPEGIEDAQVAKYCGPWAVRRVCGQLGVAVTPVGAMRLCTSDRGNSSMGDMARAFEASGLKVTAQEMGMDEMKALAAQPGKKVILHMPRHFMVVESVDEKGVVLSDSSNPSQRLSFERLAIYWDGYLLCVEK